MLFAAPQKANVLLVREALALTARRGTRCGLGDLHVHVARGFVELRLGRLPLLLVDFQGLRDLAVDERLDRRLGA